MKAAGQTLMLAGIWWPSIASGLTQRRFTAESGHTDRIGQAVHNILLSNHMNTELTEEEMRRALFGEPKSPAPAINSHVQGTVPYVVTVQPVAKKKKASKASTPRLRVTLRVGNEFEGKMHEEVHEVDTLSTLVSEQEAQKTDRKKFKFVEVISVKSM